MLQAGESAADAAIDERREWMALLAQAPLEMLERWYSSAEGGALPCRVWLRQPESGLAMVRGRVGGSGEPFNLGELTITRCTLRLATGEVGVAYVRGRSRRKAELAALADALLQSTDHREPVRRGLIEPLGAHLRAEKARALRKAQATRVEFFTLAREAGE